MQQKSKVQEKCTILLSGILAISASIATANDEAWFINPMFGYQWFDNDRYLDDDNTVGLGLEYHYNNHWGVELKYFNSNPDGEDGDTDARLNQLMVEGLYRFEKQGQFQPHLAAGLGHADFDYGVVGSNKETQVTAGVGVRYWLNERWSAKTDLRMVHSIDDRDTDQLLTFAISYALGKTVKHTPVEPVPLAQPEPVAMPVNELPKDSDSDGVLDNVDQCPNTPYKNVVGKNGCTKKLIYNKTISMDVKFASNNYRIGNDYLPELEKVARFMKQYPTVSGAIEGHTDDAGTAAYNKQLSQRRANAVRQVLIEIFDVNPERLYAIGYGEEKPIADNSTTAGRQMNRRVVAVFAAEVTEVKTK